MNQKWVCHVFVCYWTAGVWSGVAGHRKGMLTPCKFLSFKQLNCQLVELSTVHIFGASVCPRAACVLACVPASLRAVFPALWPPGRALPVVRPKICDLPPSLQPRSCAKLCCLDDQLLLLRFRLRRLRGPDLDRCHREDNPAIPLASPACPDLDRGPDLDCCHREDIWEVLQTDFLNSVPAFVSDW